MYFLEIYHSKDSFCIIHSTVKVALTISCIRNQSNYFLSFFKNLLLQNKSKTPTDKKLGTRLKDKQTFCPVSVTSVIYIDEIALFRMFPAERAKQEGLSYEGIEGLCVCAYVQDGVAE